MKRKEEIKQRLEYHYHAWIYHVIRNLRFKAFGYFMHVFLKSGNSADEMLRIAQNFISLFS